MADGQITSLLRIQIIAMVRISGKINIAGKILDARFHPGYDGLCFRRAQRAGNEIILHIYNHQNMCHMKQPPYVMMGIYLYYSASLLDMQEKPQIPIRFFVNYTCRTRNYAV
jgi:hypothetical protein